jgi:hypothetical protein
VPIQLLQFTLFRLKYYLLIFKNFLSILCNFFPARSSI